MSDDLVPLPVDESFESELLVEGWAPRDDMAVERALRFLDHLARRYQRVAERAAAWHGEILLWEQSERARLTGPATVAVLALESFALAQRRATGVKQFHYPSGSIETKAGVDKRVITDEAALLAWCEVNCPEAIKRVEPTVLVSKLPRDGTKVVDGRLVTADGEVVPGLSVQVGANYASATVKLASNRELPKGSS